MGTGNWFSKIKSFKGQQKATMCEISSCLRCLGCKTQTYKFCTAGKKSPNFAILIADTGYQRPSKALKPIQELYDTS